MNVTFFLAHNFKDYPSADSLENQHKYSAGSEESQSI